MFYLIPTKRGLGVEFWGSYNDLCTIYEVISTLWDLEIQKTTAENMLSDFLFNIRHAYQGDHFTRTSSHFLSDSVPSFGFQISWVQLIFVISFINSEKTKYPKNKLLEGILLQMEYWVETALVSFDKKVGMLMQTFIGQSIDGANPFIYYYMRRINAEFFGLKGGKKGFKDLPELVSWGIKGTKGYNLLKIEIIKSAIKIGCDPIELDLDEDQNIYSIQW
ncbi:hypothetical protein [Rhodonellum sp.]|uniref:DUF6904 family protein n=1 Tax=Rhodonellum sp. TaxID=2231180 RepID=UPI002723DD3B|nr:hypothetical protein [Rhodonellum sp.]MDO9553305.1 hypothetical protein [Rhodonellum sp.]